jgi:hypothetical protein
MSSSACNVGNKQPSVCLVKHVKVGQTTWRAASVILAPCDGPWALALYCMSSAHAKVCEHVVVSATSVY